MKYCVRSLICLVLLCNCIVFAEEPPVERWVARYNKPGSRFDDGVATAMDSYSNIYVTGQSKGSGTSDYFATIKYDSNGNQKWVACYDGRINGYDCPHDIAVDEHCNVYVTGQSNDPWEAVTIKY